MWNLVALARSLFSCSGYFKEIYGGDFSVKCKLCRELKFREFYFLAKTHTRLFLLRKFFISYSPLVLTKKTNVTKEN